jgi:lysophospholipase L1-like esterase
VKTILCFGDSNTYGESPEGFGRYEYHERWPGRLQQLLGNDFLVIEEGLNGRTTVWEDPVEADKSGFRHLPSCLMSHAPLDIVILMLGTNDLKQRFSATPTDIAQSAERLVKLVLKSENGHRDMPPQVILAAPTCILSQTFLGEVFGNKHEASLRLGELYQNVAVRTKVAFINIADVAWPSELDGLHLDRKGHEKVALAMYEMVLSVFSTEQEGN